MAKAKTHQYTPIAQMTRAEIVDELGPLDDWYQEHKPRIDRREALREVIRGGGAKKLTGWAEIDQKARTEGVQYDGAKYQVQLSACAAASRIPSLHKIWLKVGNLRFLQACSLSLTAARELIPTADADGLIVTDPDGGTRTIVAVVPHTARRAA